MASVKVQFRQDAETIGFLRRLGLKPTEVAKAAFEREVRQLRAEEHARKLEASEVELPPGLAGRAVRESRDKDAAQTPLAIDEDATLLTEDKALRKAAAKALGASRAWDLAQAEASAGRDAG